MKKILSITLAIGMAVMGAVVPVSASLSSQNAVVYDTLYLGEITGDTTVNVPRNIDGNQGVKVFSATILNNHIDRNFGIEFSDFTDMTDLNIAIYIGTERVEERMNVSAGTISGFRIPGDVSAGTSFRVVVSSNTAGDNATAHMQIR